MNWKEIQTLYPKAFEQMIAWVNISDVNNPKFGQLEYNAEVGYNLPIGSFRWLYDFFDSFPIFIILQQFDDGDFYALVRLFENYGTDKYAKEGHLDWEFYAGKDHESGIFTNRIDAEIDGFEHAFELLNNL